LAARHGHSPGNEGADSSALRFNDTTPGGDRQPARLPLYTADGKVGAVVVDGILTKSIRASVHVLRNPPALALDCGVVAQAEGLGVTEIVITDSESNTVYRASLGELYRHGWRFDRGYGAQYAMRLTCWHKGGDQVAPVAAAEPEVAPQVAESAAAPLQLALL
jgi:hypothetical protein